MGPTSKVLLALLLIVVAALFWLLARSGRWLVQGCAAVLTFLLSVTTGVLIVNDYYGYYTSWGAAFADLAGGGTAYAIAHGLTASTASRGSGRGRLLSIELPGKRSGINRKGLVYLPPQYFESRYRSVRFPVVELFHGSPGDPPQWVNQLRVTTLVQKMIDNRQLGPVVLVMPDSNGGVTHTEECLNTPAVHDDTYVSTDVPADIRSRFRVSADSGQWGTMGLSSGGYCAANLMLRHPSDFGSVVSLDGYYRPDVENAAAIIGSNRALSRANDPLAAALRLRPGSVSLPPFFVAAGTGERSDYDYAKPMVAAVRRIEDVPFLVVRGANHTMAGIRRMLPSAFAWSWQQLCTPDQRREFPTYPFRLGQTVVTAPLAHPIPEPRLPGHISSSAPRKTTGSAKHASPLMR